MIKVLLIGDIHIGRRPSSLPRNLADFGLSVSDLTPAAAWHRAVRYALEEGVDAVILAGDVVEYDNYMFEAFGHVDKGVKDLVSAEIPVLGVAGNHDVEALPRLAKAIPEFRLVGEGGRWECVPVQRDGKTLFHLLGWSFPKREVRENPFLLPMDDLPGDGPPVFGVIHADVGASGGTYAPVRNADLQDPRITAWFLGHMHKPSDFSSTPPIGYLGSLVGLDPGEPGQRGPWLLTVSNAGSLSMEQVPLAPLRWERVDVPMDHVEDISDIHVSVESAVSGRHRELTPTLGETRLVGCRLVFTGRTVIHREIREIVQADELRRDFHQIRDGVVYFIEKIVDECTSELDLVAIGRHNDPPGLLARHMKELSAGGAEAENLVKETRRHLERSLSGMAWFRHGENELTDEMVIELLERAGVMALEALLPDIEAGVEIGEEDTP